jgi:hypothetical protein
MLVSSRLQISAESLSPQAILIVYLGSANLPIVKRATVTVELMEGTMTESLESSKFVQHRLPSTLQTPRMCPPVRLRQRVRLIVPLNLISTLLWAAVRAI